jgi:hypothetical protein
MDFAFGALFGAVIVASALWPRIRENRESARQFEHNSDFWREQYQRELSARNQYPRDYYEPEDPADFWKKQ